LVSVNVLIGQCFSLPSLCNSHRSPYQSPEEALDHVAGYCVVNDLSERDFQIHRSGQWVKGKSCDTFGPIGPWLVTRDEIPNPQDLDMYLEVNGNRYQNGSTKTMHFDVATCISHLSQFMSLQPGEAENARHRHDFLTTGADELKRLKAEGKIAAFGLGVNETQVCIDIMKLVPLDVILIAERLSLLDRSAEVELTGLCREAGTSLVLGGIFNSGILATGAKAGATYDYGPAPEAVLEAVRKLEVEASEAGLSIAEAALQFAMNHPSATSVLLGRVMWGFFSLILMRRRRYWLRLRINSLT